MCSSDNVGCCILISLLVFALSGFIGMGCLIGYKVNSDANTRLVPAKCNPYDYTTVFRPLGCSYSCNCNSNGCATCYEDCWDGFVAVTITNVTNGYSVYVITDRTSATHAKQYMMSKWPAFTEFTCFYYVSPFSVQFDLNAANGPYIAGLVFCGISCAALLWFLIIVLAWCFPICCDYFGTSTRICCNRMKQSIADRKAAKLVLESERQRRESKMIGVQAEVAPISPLSMSQLIEPPSAPEKEPEALAPPLMDIV